MSTARQDVRARWQRLRWPAAVAAVVLLVALVGALSVPRSSGGDLDPDSAAPGGSRALAQILAERGVAVSRLTRAADAEATGAGSTLVVLNTRLLGPGQLDRLAAGTAELVLVRPDSLTLQRLAPGVRPAGVVAAREAAPACRLPVVRTAGRVRAGGNLYRVQAPATGCYPDPGDRAAFSFVQVDVDGRQVSVIGQPDVLTNEHLAGDGNAAFALTVLGAQPRLAWYLPDPLELSSAQDPPTLGELTPRWVPFVLLQLGLSALVALLWRGRRLGRLVAEPLPVVVRAAETQEGRARLYRQSGARGRAAATLRTAALRRLAARLDVPAQAAPPDVADLVATASGRPAPDVRDILLGPAPADDAGLVRLAADLDSLAASLSGGTARLAPATAGTGQQEETT